MTETTKEALTRTLDGVVTSNKMDKTVTVLVEPAVWQVCRQEQEVSCS